MKIRGVLPLIWRIERYELLEQPEIFMIWSGKT